jgi:hypothetical protein
MVELFGMMLDFLDALGGAVAIACWWCTWVRPKAQATPLRKAHGSEGPEIARFLQEVRRCPSSRRLCRDDARLCPREPWKPPPFE